MGTFSNPWSPASRAAFVTAKANEGKVIEKIGNTYRFKPFVRSVCAVAGWAANSACIENIVEDSTVTFVNVASPGYIKQNLDNDICQVAFIFNDGELGSNAMASYTGITAANYTLLANPQSQCGALGLSVATRA